MSLTANMLFQEFFTHYPSRLLWAGGCLFSVFACCSAIFLLRIADQPNFPSRSHRTLQVKTLSPLPTLRLKSEERCPLSLELLKEVLEKELIISLSPPRIDTWESKQEVHPIAHVRLKGGGQSKRISLPSRLDLAFNDREQLTFQNIEGPFWVELSLEERELIANLAMIWAGQEMHIAFSCYPNEPLLQKSDEFFPGSAWRLLGEARWWGVDVVSQLDSGAPKQKIEIGSIPFDIDEQDWMVWEENRWYKSKDLEEIKGLPIAKIRAVSASFLEWDAWDEKGSSHVRIGTPLQNPLANSRPKIEDWFSSVRVRSGKQISCILEKQCLILRLGEWVLKDNGRWRVLRKIEEKQHLLSGKKIGDLIILEQIEPKHGIIRGRLFLANRTQVFPIELVAINRSKQSARPHSARAL